MVASCTWLLRTVFAVFWTAVGLLLAASPVTAGDYTYTFVDILVNESDGTADLTVQLNQNVLSDEEITLQIKDDDTDLSARKGSDYKNPPNKVTIDAGQDNARFSVPIVDDTEIEGDEYFYITIEPQLTLGSGTIVPAGAYDPIARVTIADNDLTVVFNAGTNGTLDGGQSQITQQLNPGTSTSPVTATGNSAQGWEFEEWSILSGDGSGTFSDLNGPTLTISNVTGNIEVAASYKKISVTLTMQKTGEGTGTTSPSVEDPGPKHTYDWGTAVAVTAVPNAETSEFAGWSANVVNGVVTMNGNQTVIANFDLKKFSVTLLAGDNGALQGSSGELSDSIIQEITYGQNASMVSALPDEHHHFVNWSGDAANENQDLLVTNVTRNMEIHANFAIDKYLLTFISDDFGHIEVDGVLYEDRYEELVAWGGVSSRVTAVLDDNRFFLGWSGDFTSDAQTIQITDVQQDMATTYVAVPDIEGCATDVAFGYTEGFEADDFEMINVEVGSESGNLVLNTGVQGIDPNNIVIPFKQDVYVTFLYEGAGFRLSDFGWMFAADGPSGTKHPIYSNINDNNNDGVLDGQTDINQDGVIDRHDNKRYLGTIAGETEIVFYLDSTDNGCGNWCGSLFFTKQDWNTDTHGRCTAQTGVSRLIQLYATADEGDTACNSYTAGCAAGVPTQGWLDEPARLRLQNDFGFNFRAPQAGDPTGFNTECIDESNGSAPTHAIVGAPDETPFAWVVGFDDTTMDDPDKNNDYDYNDVVFLIERKTGGMARLQSSNAIVPNETSAYFTAVDIDVYDYHPSGVCQGKTTLSYYVSVNDGADGTWVEVTAWDRIQSFTLDSDDSMILGSDIVPSQWIPGSPEYTRRSRRVDMAALGRTGTKLVWKVELVSEHQDCVPRVVDVLINADTASHGTFMRASPVIQANIIYAGSYETPAPSWNDQTNRGHLTASRVYDPQAPDHTLSGDQTLWDAGRVLTDMNPDDRNVYFPDIAVTEVVDEHLRDRGGDLIRGDGVTRTFSGTLAHHPVAATSLRIYDDQETFSDRFTDDLKGNFNGSGRINRFTGEWRVTFQAPPMSNVPLIASYRYYTTSQILREFTAANLTNSMLALTDEIVWPTGYIHDFNLDGAYTQADGDWLVQWIRGYRQPNTAAKKEWLLGAIDHSVPAVMVPPGFPLWYFGSKVTLSEQESYNNFRLAHQDRETLVFVGARDGMIHAFDAGKFRWGDNPETTAIRENRGHYLWEPITDDSPDYCDDYTGNCPGYGTGEERWAFIPVNLIPRLKNSVLKAEDQSFVDASPALSDVYIDTNGDGDEDAWRTVLLAAEGNGGDSVFCLDVTDPDHPRFLWEFAAPELFRSRSSPAVAQIGRIRNPETNRPKWVAFFVTGKVENADLFPAVYMIDISNGRVLQRVVLDAAVDLDGNGFIDSGETNYGKGGVPSGQPAIVDSDENGFIDRLYVGSDRGFMYKVNIPDDPDNPGYDITHCVLNTDFIDQDGNQVPLLQQWHSVYASPAVVIDNGITPNGDIDYRILVLFGTGDSPYYDEDINTANTRYHFFAYVDTAKKGECNPDKHLLDWYVELPQGHRVFASAFAAAGRIYFGTSTAETEDPCEGHRQVNGNEGRMFILTLAGAILMDQVVGDIRTAPLVEDQHLYFITPTGLQSLGNGIYNNEVQAAGTPTFKLRAWQELD
jgi:hypothetical protein